MPAEIGTMDPNSYKALLRRLDGATLSWRGPSLMLFARAACAVGAQALVAVVFALRSSSTPWHDAEPWLPVYGTLIDAGCLALLWWLTRREGIGPLDLLGFERTRLVRDALLGLAVGSKRRVGPSLSRGCSRGRLPLSPLVKWRWAIGWFTLRSASTPWSTTVTLPSFFASYSCCLCSLAPAPGASMAC